MLKCNCCHKSKAIDQFPQHGKHVKKNGEIVIYRRKTCKACFAGQERVRKRQSDRDEFNKLVGWPATLLSALLVVTGIFQYDAVSGKNRMCVYESMYGHHSVTIDAMRMCPLTWDFDV